MSQACLLLQLLSLKTNECSWVSVYIRIIELHFSVAIVNQADLCATEYIYAGKRVSLVQKQLDENLSSWERSSFWILDNVSWKMYVELKNYAVDF